MLGHSVPQLKYLRVHLGERVTWYREKEKDSVTASPLQPVQVIDSGQWRTKSGHKCG